MAAVTVLGAEGGIQLLKLVTEPVQTGGQGRGAAGVVVASPGLALSPETGLASERVTALRALLLQVKAGAPPGTLLLLLLLLLLARARQDEGDGVLPALQTQPGEVAQFAPVSQVEQRVGGSQALLLQSRAGESSGLTVNWTERT